MNKMIEILFCEKNYTSLRDPVMLWSNEQKFPNVLIKFIFLKIPYFKNRNSDSYILLKSIAFTVCILPFLIVTSYLFIHLLIHLHSSGSLDISFASKKAIDDILDFVTKYPRKMAILWVPVLSIVYWNLRTKFAGQWIYCADLYNKISFESIDTKNPREILYQRCTLSLDLLQTDLYSHKSFSKTFNVALEKSIFYVYRFHPDYLKEINEVKNIWFITKTKENYINEIERFRIGQASTEQAYKYIAKLQNDLDNLLTEEFSADYIEKGV